jgi:hypothetical protein
MVPSNAYSDTAVSQLSSFHQRLSTRKQNFSTPSQIVLHDYACCINKNLFQDSSYALMAPSNTHIE